MNNRLQVIFTDEEINFTDYIRIISKNEFAQIMGMNMGEETRNIEKEKDYEDER